MGVKVVGTVKERKVGARSGKKANQGRAGVTGTETPWRVYGEKDCRLREGVCPYTVD